MTQLKRSISPFFLTCYGLGTILGAGIYVLVGKVAALSGMATPFAFLLAAFIAAHTAVSYAELSARIPKSGGEPIYVDFAFHKTWATRLVGFLIMTTGVVSAATIANGFVGYLNLFLTVDRIWAILALVSTLSLLAIWGIQESLFVAALITFIELGGLLFILFIAGDSLMSLPSRFEEMLSTSGIEIALGAFLSFYAYIGFEDMVNIAEEVKEPQKSLPKAIFWALGLSTVLYVLIAFIAVLAIPLETLSGSSVPLAAIVENRGYSPHFIGLVSLFAVVNGALVQIIMASRVLYGMASFGFLHSGFSHVHHKTKTPIVATLTIGLIVLLLAFIGSLESLAKLTSFIILIIFSLVNLALVVLKFREPHPENVTTYSLYFPIAGIFLCFSFLLVQLLGQSF